MRLEGWEPRLRAIIDDARARPYVLGVHDCFSFACRVIAALTGHDPWPAHAGYRSRAEAVRRLAALGQTFESAFDVVFGLPRIDVRHARRGDIAALQDDVGEKHLAVVVDHRAACMLPQGLLFIDAACCHCAWRVE